MMDRQSPLIIWLRLFIRMTLFALMLMLPAGTWLWREAWALVVLWFIYGVIMVRYLLHHNPALLAERLKLVPFHKEQKNWDKVIMLLFFIFGIGLYLVPGLDVVRYQWSEPLPLWMRLLAMLLHLPCFVLLGWIMHENSWLSQVVKIDHKRGHQVITSGPYAIIRHPMYTVIIILLFAVPVALGSRYALILAVFLTVLLIVRTYLEDRTLHEELAGYADYARQIRYRLLPGIW